ncbi:MAG: hypothetical protein ACK4LQ_10810 [Pararhodobacter sp.]
MKKRISTWAVVIALAGCTALPEASRSVIVGDESFAYSAYEGYWSRYAELQPVEDDRGFRSGLVITLTARNGAPLTEADRAAACLAAQRICEESRRRWFEDDAGVFLASGGLSFAGACG